MKDLGELLLRIAAFCFIGAGAAVASIGIPIIEYAQDERVLRYEVEEATGKLPSVGHCVVDSAKERLAECKTSLYMQDVLVETKAQLNRWIQILTVLGVVSVFLSLMAYGFFFFRRQQRAEGT